MKAESNLNCKKESDGELKDKKNLHVKDEENVKIEENKDGSEEEGKEKDNLENIEAEKDTAMNKLEKQVDKLEDLDLDLIWVHQGDRIFVLIPMEDVEHVEITRSSQCCSYVLLNLQVWYDDLVVVNTRCIRLIAWTSDVGP